MHHLVRFTTAEGRDGHHYADSLEDAVAFVERLRNHEGAGDVRLYQLTEVPMEFRTYYRVEVGQPGHQATHAPHEPQGHHPQGHHPQGHHPQQGTPELPPMQPLGGLPRRAVADEPPAPAEHHVDGGMNGRRLFSRG